MYYKNTSSEYYIIYIDIDIHIYNHLVHLVDFRNLFSVKDTNYPEWSRPCLVNNL